MTQHIPTLAILGATGSVGQSALSVLEIDAYKEAFCLFLLSGLDNAPALIDACLRHTPRFACIHARHVDAVQSAVSTQTQVFDVAELDGFLERHRVDVVIAAIVGAAGLSSTLAAAKMGGRILLANKESMVMAGDLILQTARAHKTQILPIDSEHNALYQCLPTSVQTQQSSVQDAGVRHLWLTASGGRFLNASAEDMARASIKEATHHPTYKMGAKISVDSSTLMNKTLEVIEAAYLFDVDIERIKVVVHPQSVIHSMVEYEDGSFIAQMGAPDMKTPIAHALVHPKRLPKPASTPLEWGRLEFLPLPDAFDVLGLAQRAMHKGQKGCIALNAANEVAVNAFLDSKIRLSDIRNLIECVLADLDEVGQCNSLADIQAFDAKMRTLAHFHLSQGAI